MPTRLSLVFAALILAAVVAPGLARGQSAVAPVAPTGIPNPGTELSATQRRQLQLLIESDETLRTQVREGITAELIGQRRREMEQEQSKFFADQKQFVLIAYGIMWALVVGFVVFMFLRQRKLEGEIASLEARVKAASKT